MLYIALKQTWKHVQIITRLQLNQALLLVRYLSNSVNCCLLANTLWTLSLSFSNTKHQRMVRTGQFSCCSAKLHFFDSCTVPAAQRWTQWLQYNIYGVIRHHEYKSAVLKKSSSNWLNSGKPLTHHLKGATIAFSCSSMHVEQRQ